MMQLRVAFWATINGTRYLPGDEVTIDDDAYAAQLIQDGLCRPWDTTDAAPAASQAGVADPGLEHAPLPERAAPKGEWVRYAIGQGMPEDEARAMSRADLIACHMP
ncbi:hypothetical protein [Actinomadura litoris]|uniref:hypothetical protein n=1 Tax=Actinomadura litoris TaxID=2678616 RepID=UPI001FA6BE6D|nr:hypothetical protein [Actinomadura litoris]